MSGNRNATTPAMRSLSPRRNTTQASSVEQLVAEQLVHFGIDPATEYGRTLSNLASRLYMAEADSTLR